MLVCKAKDLKIRPRDNNTVEPGFIYDWSSTEEYNLRFPSLI
jgi:hypothetical protein